MRRFLTPLALLAVMVAGACAPAAQVEAPARVQQAAGPPPHYPSTPPALRPAPELRLPTPVQRTLPNGLTVVYVPHGDLPIVQAVLVTRGGTSDDPERLPGLASFTAEMLDEGAGGKSALELSEAIEFLGASLFTTTGWDAAQIYLSVLRERFPQALALMGEVAFRPDFPEREIQRIRQERLTELARGRDEARVIAGNAFASLLYGGGHPYGRLATMESTRQIARRSLVDFHRSFYRPGNSTLILVGNVDESLHPVVERVFGAWPRGAAAAPSLPGPPAASPARIYLIDRPDAPQSEIRIGHPAVERNNPDFYPLMVLNTVLGGSFTSRLMQNLREKHAYTYGAGSSFSMRRGAGPFMASSAVVTTKTDSAVIQFFHELNRIREEPVPEDELERAKNYIALTLPQTFESTRQVAGRIAELVIYDLPLNYYDTYVRNVMAVTAADVQRVARQYVRPEQASIVIVGDRRAVEEGLRALPVGAVEIRRVEEFVP